MTLIYCKNLQLSLKNEQAIEDDVLPFGFINDGTGGSVAENDEFGADTLLTHAEWDIDDTQGIF